jgi:CRP/FNR family transcriptional regulator, cyclic AMP receptor protein
VTQADPAAVPAAEHLWNLLSEHQRTILLRAGTRHTHPAGTVLLREGDPTGSVLILLSGRVKVLATGLRGHQGLLAVRVPGDILGELAAIDGKPRSATVVSVDLVTILRMPAADFNAILSAHPGIAHALLKVIVSRLRTANLRRIEYGETTVAQRLAGVLTELAAEHGDLTARSAAVTVPYGQDDLAKMVAGSREAVVRALRAWRAAGIITTGRNKVTIRYPEALASQTPTSGRF